MARLVVINHVSKAARFSRAAVSAVLDQAFKLWPKKIKDKKVALVFVSRGEVRRLNRVYRQKDQATNVLSFKSLAADELGDIVICYKLARAEAKLRGEKTDKHITYLFTHGLLHLLGFDHQSKGQEKNMEQATKKLLTFRAK